MQNDKLNQDDAVTVTEIQLDLINKLTAMIPSLQTEVLIDLCDVARSPEVLRSMMCDYIVKQGGVVGKNSFSEMVLAARKTETTPSSPESVEASAVDEDEKRIKALMAELEAVAVEQMGDIRRDIDTALANCTAAELLDLKSILAHRGLLVDMATLYLNTHLQGQPGPLEQAVANARKGTPDIYLVPPTTPC